MKLSNEEKNILLNTARETIKSYIKNSYPEELNFGEYKMLKTKAGAFVTLTIEGQLRGCIGYIISNKPLIETVKNAAFEAAFRDPRFLPLSEEEYERISIEISVLSEPFPMKTYDDIEIGKHGLIVEEGIKRGLLLPQVPIEHNMSKEEFLNALCNKAGLPTNYWKMKLLNINMFTALVFGESR